MRMRYPTVQRARSEWPVQAPSAPTARSRSSRIPHPAIVSLLTFGLVLQMGLARVLSFNPSGDNATRGTVISQLLLLFTYLIGAATLATAPHAAQILRRCWPMLALPAFAMLSSLWSVYPALTLRAAIAYALTSLLGLAVAVYLPPLKALGVMVRAMGYICILSAACALLLPQLGVHQADEAVQSVHAGLWRGILIHKVNLGLFAGLTLPLLLFYRRTAYNSSAFWLLAVVSAAACLWNAGSVTGILGAAVLFSVLTLLQSMLRTSKVGARTSIKIALTVILVLTALVWSGALNSLSLLLERSPDLTGRAELWPEVATVIRSNAIGILIGYGYVAGMQTLVGPSIAGIIGFTPSDCHNGYLEMVVAFGYAGSLLPLLVHAWLYRGSKELLLTFPSTAAKLGVLPMSLLVTAAFLNYSESEVMVLGSIFTQLTPFVAVWIVMGQPSSSQA